MKKSRIVNSDIKTILKSPKYRFRSIFLLSFIFVLLSSIVFRAFFLQVLNRDFLQDMGEQRYLRNITIPSNRGIILDRNGEPLVMNKPTKSIWVVPEDIKLTEQEIEKISKILKVKKEEVKNKIESKKNFLFLKRQVDMLDAKQVEDFKFKGFHQQDTSTRYYPNGSGASHITGFTDIENNGQEGIELFLNKELLGKDGERKVIKTRRGQIIEEVGSLVEPKNGKNIKLTIDTRIQYIASSILEEAVKKNNAKAGSVVILDAKTGEILALANAPTYDPNNRIGLTGEKLRNRAITDIFEPGSTMKPFIIGYALDKKIVTPNTILNTQGITVGNKKISDAHGHDSLSVSEIIQKSSNIGTVKIAMQISPEEMWNLMDSVGFGKKLKVEFPGEVSGKLRPYKSWLPIEQATMSFGYGVSTSLLQMAHAYLTFTNNGYIVPVSLVKKENQEIKGERVFSEDTAKKLQLMLESVTSKEGTAFQAQNGYYRVAGKTGTSHKLENGRYTNKYIGSFVGFAPVSNPKLIVAVMIDEPSSGGYYGGLVAAPIFSKIVERSLTYMGVVPDVEGSIDILH